MKILFLSACVIASYVDHNVFQDILLVKSLFYGLKEDSKTFVDMVLKDDYTNIIVKFDELIEKYKLNLEYLKEGFIDKYNYISKDRLLNGEEKDNKFDIRVIEYNIKKKRHNENLENSDEGDSKVSNEMEENKLSNGFTNHNDSEYTNIDDLLKNQEFLKDIKIFIDSNFEYQSAPLISVPIETNEPNWIRDLKGIQYIMACQILKLWENYQKRYNDEYTSKSTLIYLQSPFFVLGGRFNEMYYWDSYWVIMGLLRCNMETEAFNIIKSFVELIKTYGFIPNGTRTYYLNRTQPPLFCWMLNIIYENTKSEEIKEYILNDGLEAAEMEYVYLMSHKSIKIMGMTLNKYHVSSNTPRVESYKEDMMTYKESGKNSLIFSNLKTAAESGWDFSSRWLKDKKNLHTIEILDIIPVDLNSIMFKNEKILQKLFEEKEIKYNLIDMKSKKYSESASKRAKAINEILWNNDDGCWNDYNYKSQIYTDKYFYISNLFPLFANINIQDNTTIYDILYKYRNELFGYPGGTPTSSKECFSGEQWDFPNVWPPLVQLIIEYLYNIGERALARHIARCFYNSVKQEFIDNGLFFEKYDCRFVGNRGNGGEYEIQNGFGWTNGTIIYILKLFGESLEVTCEDDIPDIPDIPAYLKLKKTSNKKVEN